MDDDSEKKKAKGTKKYVIKRKLMFENYKNRNFNSKTILKLQKRFKTIIAMYILNKSMRLR